MGLLHVIVVLLLGIVLCCVAGAGFRHHRARPQIRSGIQPYDYQYGERSASVVSLSNPAVLMHTNLAAPTSAAAAGVDVARASPAVLLPAPGKRIHLFQLNDAQLTIDHCTISQVALMLHEEGFWTLSLRATQNPALPPDQIAVRGERQSSNEDKFTLHLKRNLFKVKIRAYGEFPLDEQLRDNSPGKPVMLTIDPDPFWVQRGEPLDYCRRKPSTAVSKYFDYITRVEVEFFYFR